MSNKIPWNGLNDCLEVIEHDGKIRVCLSQKNNDEGKAATNKLQHFSRCLEAKIQEFRATDSWQDVKLVSERERYDHTKWGNFKSRACDPENMSVLCGYIDLHLLLLDEKKWRPFFKLRYESCNYLTGETDRGHPAWLADTLRTQAFHNSPYLGKLNADTTNVLRTYLKELFRVMYRSPADTADAITQMIIWHYSLPVTV